MSLIATFISLVVIIGAALVVLTAVVGYGCYSSSENFPLNRQGSPGRGSLFVAKEKPRLGVVHHPNALP
jgi:hypothetical protein